MVMKKNQKFLRSSITYLILFIALLWTLFPIYWMIKSSLSVDNEMYVARPSLFPSKVTFDHYIELFSQTKFMTNLWNSLLVAGITTVLCLVISILASYAMTRLRFPLRSVFKNSIVLSYLLPTAVLFIPMYVLVNGLGLSNNKYALLIYLSYICSALLLFYANELF